MTGIQVLSKDLGLVVPNGRIIGAIFLREIGRYSDEDHKHAGYPLIMKNLHGSFA